MQITQGAPNSFKLKEIKRHDDGTLLVLVALDNQEEYFSLADIVSEEEYSSVEAKIKEAFGVFLPGLINKIMNQ